MYECNEIIPSFSVFNDCAATQQVFMKRLSLELLQPVLQSIRLDCTGSESSRAFWETCFQFSPLNTLYFLSLWWLQEEINSTRLMVKDLLRLASALNRRRSKFQFQLLSSFLTIIYLPCPWTPPKISLLWCHKGRIHCSQISDTTAGQTWLSCGWFWFVFVFLQQNLLCSKFMFLQLANYDFIGQFYGERLSS